MKGASPNVLYDARRASAVMPGRSAEAEGGAREIREEANVSLDPTKLEPFWFTSTAPKPNRVLLFSIASPINASTLGAYQTNTETSERGLIPAEGVFRAER
jgi:hypothetical protein